LTTCIEHKETNSVTLSKPIQLLISINNQVYRQQKSDISEIIWYWSLKGGYQFELATEKGSQTTKANIYKMLAY
jgi:hypothetical protein